MSPGHAGSGNSPPESRLISLLSRLVPRDERTEWVEEWCAELEHIRAPSAPGGWTQRWRRYLGAAEDAVHLRIRGITPPAGIHDVRFALRSLSKNPGYTIVALLTLTLGIGANTAIFTVVNAYILRPLPLPEADRVLVLLGMTGDRIGGVSAPDYLDWKEQSTSFSSMGAMHRFGVTLTGGEAPLRIRQARVTPAFFDVAGVAPLYGRTFTSEEATLGNDRVAVVGFELWRTAFGADPEIVGASVMLDGEPHTLVGVMPASFRFPPMSDQIWRPLAFTEVALNRRGMHNLWVFGRLANGVSTAEAASEMNVIASNLEEAFPETNNGQSVRVRALHEFALDGSGRGVFMLFGAAGFVLLIACANVANLTLTRGAAREQEIAIRTALGASRSRIVGQLLVESLVLSVAGGALGIAAAYLSLGLIESNVPQSLARVGPLTLDAGVLLFAAAVASVTGLGSGLFPSLRVTGSSAHSVAFSGVATSLWGRGTARRARSAMVVAEFAMAVVLLVGAGLFLRSIERLYSADLGLDTSDAMAFGLVFPQADYPVPANVTEGVNSVLQQLESEPTIQAVAGISQLPLTGRGLTSALLIEGGPAEMNADSPSGNLRMVSPGYFELLGIALTEGRALTNDDTENAPLVVMINQAAASRYWGAEDPVGKWMSFTEIDGQPMHRRVIGVTEDVRQSGPAGSVFPEVYLPHRQTGEVWLWNGAAMSFVVKPAPGGVVGIEALRRAVGAVDPNLPINSLRTLESMVGFTVAGARFNSTLLVGFSVLALLLAVVGIYGVMSFSVRQRTREIGVHVAIGANRSDIVRRVVFDGVRLAAMGTALGVLGALGLSRLVRSMLFEVSAADPVTYVGVVLVLATATVGACFMPARRASRIDPVEALRAE
ncbi:MAG: ABC transporter permease [Gemmatimonadota bacterium]|nr:MAG: ABC transporter permease [Gemmatimonadota bacterium]